MVHAHRINFKPMQGNLSKEKTNARKEDKCIEAHSWTLENNTHRVSSLGWTQPLFILITERNGTCP